MFQGKRSDLTGEGIVRSAGGWVALKSKRGMEPHLKGDERILGDSEFVKQVLGRDSPFMGGHPLNRIFSSALYINFTGKYASQSSIKKLLFRDRKEVNLLLKKKQKIY